MPICRWRLRKECCANTMAPMTDEVFFFAHTASHADLDRQFFHSFLSPMSVYLTSVQCCRCGRQIALESKRNLRGFISGSFIPRSLKSHVNCQLVGARRNSVRSRAGAVDLLPAYINCYMRRSQVNR